VRKSKRSEVNRRTETKKKNEPKEKGGEGKSTHTHTLTPWHKHPNKQTNCGLAPHNEIARPPCCRLLEPLTLSTIKVDKHTEAEMRAASSLYSLPLFFFCFVFD